MNTSFISQTSHTSQTSPIRVGILGCAQIAQRSLAPAFLAHPAFQLVAVASRTPDKAAAFIANLSHLSNFSSITPCTYDELVSSSSVDLVYCPLPTGLHYKWVMKALNAGKHVLCEKSLGCNYDEVSEMVATARKHNKLLMESFQFRFHPQNLFVKKLLADNVIGELRSVYVKFGFPPFPDGEKNIRYKKELGGGALLDAGAYTIKATTYLLGHDVDVVAAERKVRPGESVDLDGSLILRRKSDKLLSATSYGFHNYYQCGYELLGEKGRIVTTRAFTAKADFEAEVRVETTAGGVKVEKFKADHFALLLDYVSDRIAANDFDSEYAECLIQSELVTKSAIPLNIDLHTNH